MLLDFYLVLSEVAWALHKLLWMGLGQSLLTALDEHKCSATSQISSSIAAAATARYAMKLPTLMLSNALADFSQVSPCLTDSLDSQTSYQDSTGEPGTEKRHILHTFQPLQKLSERSQ